MELNVVWVVIGVVGVAALSYPPPKWCNNNVCFGYQRAGAPIERSTYIDNEKTNN